MKDPFHILDTIRRKRDGHALSTEEIQHLVRSVADPRLPGAPTEAQIGAFLMAVFLRGLDGREVADLTSAMRFSGEVFDSSALERFTVDKHSTGGVGDKTSLLIAPVVAAAGLADPMISGRALGHTGGTLDKLETIPGFRTQISLAEMADIVRRCGFAMAGQTPQLVPADRILYALRDHTATVESPYLICASIMSKKLAAGLNALVLDVKTGSGAFMSRYEDSRYLAELMVRTGDAAGTRTVALLTSMDQPLGRFSGNWVEVWECVDILKDVRHPKSADLIELSNILAGWMLYLGGDVSSPEAGASRSDELLRSGAAYAAWLEMVRAQGGDPSVFGDPAAFHRPGATRAVLAAGRGYLASMDCTEIGWAVQRLGAGRTRPGEPVDAHAGIEMHVKLGEHVERGQPLFTMFAAQESLLDEPERMIRGAVRLADARPEVPSLVREVITGENLG